MQKPYEKLGDLTRRGKSEGMVLAGIDLAWNSKTNPTALAVGKLQQGGLILVGVTQDLFSVEAVLDELRRHTGLQGIAIDAPLVIKNRSGQRECERLIGKQYGSRKAACHTSNLTRYPEPDSTRLSKCLERDGFRHLGSSTERWQLECYPHPALIEIFVLNERHLYKKGSVDVRRRGQCRLGRMLRELQESPVLPLLVPKELAAPFDPNQILTLKGKALKRNEDVLDAVVCLYIAALYAIGVSNEVFGDEGNGYIYVPRRKCI